MQKKFQINKLPYYFLLLLFFFIRVLLAQEKEIEVGIVSNPEIRDSWWLEKNNFGIKPAEIDFKIKWQLERPEIKYNINVFLQEDSSYLSESFIRYNFSDQTFLRIGRYYRDFSNYLNDELSSGHMLISKNSEPMPKIGFVTSKKIKKFKHIDFDFGISHGIFDKNDFYNKAPMLHEKFLYMNIDKKDYEISIGFVHEAMWGGSTIDDGNQPDSFSDFLRVFIAEDRKIEDYNSIPSHPDWHPNALGNHIGIWDISFKKTNKNRSTKFYYQHIFEDTSGLRFRNEIDGLWGLELEDYLPNTNILFEYLDTSHYDLDPPYVYDKYYFHHTYKLGWSYKDYTLGNPFISHSDFSPLKIFHIGIKGKIVTNYDYKINLSRRIDINDPLVYKMILGKSIMHQDRFFNFHFIIANDSNGRNGLGIGISFVL